MKEKVLLVLLVNLANKLIILQYVSDGNAYDLDSRIPKLAEEALYAYIIYAILSVSSGIQEYVVRRFKQERSAKLRNAKIRLSNLKLDQIVQVMRGKSKWIKSLNMAEIKNSFLRSKMNKDLDDRLIPNGEYRDAQNISVGKSEDDDIGALETVLGNTEKTFTITPAFLVIYKL